MTFTPHTWPLHLTCGQVHLLFKVAKDTWKDRKPGFPLKLLIEFSLCIWSNVRIHQYYSDMTCFDGLHLKKLLSACRVLGQNINSSFGPNTALLGALW